MCRLAGWINNEWRGIETSRRETILDAAVRMRQKTGLVMFKRKAIERFGEDCQETTREEDQERNLD